MYVYPTECLQTYADVPCNHSAKIRNYIVENGCGVRNPPAFPSFFVLGQKKRRLGAHRTGVAGVATGQPSHRDCPVLY